MSPLKAERGGREGGNSGGLNYCRAWWNHPRRIYIAASFVLLIFHFTLLPLRGFLPPPLLLSLFNVFVLNIMKQID